MLFTVSSKEKMMGVFVVSPAGKLDTNTYKMLENKIDIIMEASPKMIVFDMENLEYISSMGIRTLAKTKKELQKADGNIALVNLQPQIKKVFDIINALPSQKIFKSIKELDQYLDAMQKKTS